MFTASISAADLDVLKNLATQQNSNAQYELGHLYQQGDGVDKDPKQAFYWLEQAAENGHPKAKAEIAEAYLNGTGTPKDPEQAIYWLTGLAVHGKLPSKPHSPSARLADSGHFPKTDRRRRPPPQLVYSELESGGQRLFLPGNGRPRRPPTNRTHFHPSIKLH